MALVRQLMIRAGADFSAMRREMREARNDLEKFKNGVKGSVAAIVGALATIGAGLGLNAAINDAIKFEALMGTLSVTLGKSMKDFVKWQGTVGDAMGFSKLEAAEMANNYSLRLKSIAKDEQDLLQKTTSLIKAAAIIRSKTGMSSIEISDRMRSAMNQEADGADELGVNVRVAAIMQSNAYKQLANNAPWEDLSEQMKKTILYYHILDSTTSNFGTEIADNTALLKGGFLAALNDAKLALGQAFLPIANIALPLLTNLARAAEAAFTKFAALMRALFPKANIKAGNETAALIDNQTSSVNDLGDAHDAAGKAATDAGKAAKKAAASVMGFDEVNGLKDSDDASDAAGGAGAAAGAMPALETGDLGDSVFGGISDSVKAMADKIRSFVSGINFQPLIDSFNRFKKALEPFTVMFFAGLKWFWDNVLVPFGTWTIQSFIPAFLDLLSGALNVLNPILTAFQPLASWLWENFLQPIAAWTGGAIVMILSDLGKALSVVGDWMKDHQEVVRNIGIAVGIFFGAWKLVEVMAFLQMSGSIAIAFSTITAAVWANTFALIANKAETLYLKVLYAIDFVKALAASTLALGKQVIQWGLATAAMIANKIALAASTAGQWLMTAAMTAWNVVVAIGAGLTWAFNAALAVLTSPITLVIAAIALLVAGVYLLIKHWDDVKRIAAETWVAIKAAWSVAAGWLDKNVVSPVGNMFSSLWGGIKNVGKTVWGEIQSVWGKASEWMSHNVIDPIANLYIGLFNGIIEGVNWVIRALNSINIDLPDWIPGVGGNSFGISIPEVPKLPKLARGGIVEGETNFGNYIAGEAGAEMIVPLENTAFVDKLAGALGTAVMNAMAVSGGSSQKSGDVVFQLDGVTLARVLSPYMAKEGQRIGGSMIQPR